MVFKTIAFIMMPLGLSLVLGAFAKTYLAATVAKGLTIATGDHLENQTWYISVYSTIPSIIRVEWPSGSGIDSIILTEPLTQWHTRLSSGAHVKLKGGVYLLIVNSSQPITIGLRGEPWKNSFREGVEGIAGVSSIVSSLLLWVAGDIIGSRRRYRGSKAV